MSKIGKNYFIVVYRAGRVLRSMYSHTLTVIPLLREKYKECKFDVFDIKTYGFSFAERKGSDRVDRVRRVSDGKVWPCVGDCALELGVPGRLIVTNIRRKKPVKGELYEFFENYE